MIAIFSPGSPNWRIYAHEPGGHAREECVSILLLSFTHLLTHTSTLNTQWGILERPIKTPEFFPM